MSSLQNEEDVSAEVRELLANYRNARRSSYEPCRADNLPHCLAGLQEELALLNIRYPFNEYTDLCEGSLRPSAMVALINAVYTLLHEHKKTKELNAAREENVHILERSITALNTKIEQLQKKLDRSKRESRQSAAEGLRAAEHASKARSELQSAQARIAQLTARLAATERSQRVTTTRVENDKQILLDRLRNKNGYQPTTLETSTQERENTQKSIIRRLHRHNSQLVDEVLALKRDHITQTMDKLHLETATDPLKPTNR